MLAKLKIKGGLEFSISKKVWENDKFKPSKKLKYLVLLCTSNIFNSNYLKWFCFAQKVSRQYLI